MTSTEPESVLVSMGSNVEPAANMRRALEELVERVELVAVSRLFETDPVADTPVPTFLNAAVEISTDLEPVDLKFRVLRQIEADLGRVRTQDRNAPRPIDLDIAMFGDRVVIDERTGLRVPDPEILRFAHVALPLADLAPERAHPITGATLREIAEGLETTEGVRLAAGESVLIERLSDIFGRA